MSDVMNRDEAMRALHAAIHGCRLCTGLPSVATPKVMGSAEARIVVVGQALSLAESIDPAARPFDDATGRTLRRWLDVDEATFYDPRLFYLTALGKCFPGKAPGGGDLPPRRECYAGAGSQFVTNRRHRVIEHDRNDFSQPAGDGRGGGDWLRQELALLCPNLVITIGARAFRYFEPGTGPHTPHVGVPRPWRETTLFPLPHPSGANRAWQTRNRALLDAAIAAVRPLVDAALER